jgi:hypothetical protein
MGMSCQLFWRTSVPGHPECHKFEAPVNDLQRVEAHISNLSLYNDHTLKYHWYDYQHQIGWLKAFTIVKRIVLTTLSNLQPNFSTFAY